MERLLSEGAYKRGGGLYPRGLVNGIEKALRNKL